jgi:hypothetical protein
MRVILSAEGDTFEMAGPRCQTLYASVVSPTLRNRTEWANEKMEESDVSLAGVLWSTDPTG